MGEGNRVETIEQIEITKKEGQIVLDLSGDIKFIEEAFQMLALVLKNVYRLKNGMDDVQVAERLACIAGKVFEIKDENCYVLGGEDFAETVQEISGKNRTGKKFIN